MGNQVSFDLTKAAGFIQDNEIETMKEIAETSLNSPAESADMHPSGQAFLYCLPSWKGVYNS